MKNTIEARKANYNRIEKLHIAMCEQGLESTFNYELEKSASAAAKVMSNATGEKVTGSQINAWLDDWWDFGREA